MIKGFRHKGLKRFYEENDRRLLNPDHAHKIRQVLTALEAAETAEELDLPAFKFHPLAGNRKGVFSVTVRANWRITFRFDAGYAYEINLEDYH